MFGFGAISKSAISDEGHQLYVLTATEAHDVALLLLDSHDYSLAVTETADVASFIVGNHGFYFFHMTEIGDVMNMSVGVFTPRQSMASVSILEIRLPETTTLSEINYSRGYS